MPATFWRMCSASAASSAMSAARWTRRSAKVEKIGPASGGTTSMNAAMSALLIRLAGVIRLRRRSRSSNFTGKATPLIAPTAKGRALTRPSFGGRRAVDPRPDPAQKAGRAGRGAEEIDRAGGGGGGARRERHASARHRLEQRGRQVGDLRAERTPRGLTLHVDVHVGRGRTGKPGGVTPCGHWMRPHGSGLPVMAMLQQADKYDGMVREIFADAGQIRAHFDAALAQVAGRP